jgi:hypothetical protein
MTCLITELPIGYFFNILLPNYGESQGGMTRTDRVITQNLPKQKLTCSCTGSLVYNDFLRKDRSRHLDESHHRCPYRNDHGNLDLPGF